MGRCFPKKQSLPAGQVSIAVDFASPPQVLREANVKRMASVTYRSGMLNPLLASIPPTNWDIDFCDCLASDLGWVGSSNVQKRKEQVSVTLYRGTSPTRKRNLSDPTVGLCQGSGGGPRGMGVFLWAKTLCRFASTILSSRGATDDESYRSTSLTRNTPS